VHLAGVRPILIASPVDAFAAVPRRRHVLVDEFRRPLIREPKLVSHRGGRRLRDVVSDLHNRAALA
jgi:hypothetical protein